MRRLAVMGLVVTVIMAGLLLSATSAQATTFAELANIYDTQLVFGQPVTINGVQVEVIPVGGGQVEVIVGGTIYTAQAGDRAGILEILATALGIPFTSAGSITSPDSASSTTTRLVFEQLVVPTVQTQKEKKRLADAKAKGSARVFGGSIKTEWTESGDENGRIYGFNLGLAQDVDNYTIGVILPYDYLDYDSLEANRVGAILFGQYHVEMSEEWLATLTANLNYMFTDYDFDKGKDDNLNTLGGGLSVGVRYIQEAYEAGLGGSWQYNKEDVDFEDDEQHLLKFGGNLGVRVTPSQVVNLFGTYNYDITDYEVDYGDDDYYELGVEYRADVTETWTFSAGYRKVVDLEDYDSDMVYIGSVWQF